MNKIKFYAIKDEKNGNKIFNNWQEAKEYIELNKIKEFKSFLTKIEAISFLENKDIYEEEINKLKNDFDLIAFSDGSYSNEKNLFSYGAVLFYKDDIVKMNGYYNNPKYIEYKNISGEIFGVIKVLTFSLKNNIEKVLINFDYLGIKNWALNIWKQNNELTQNYYNFFNTYVNGIINVEFKKIKSHTNNKYNDLADKLAKMALEKEIIKNSFIDSYYMVLKKSLNYDTEKIFKYIKNNYENINIKNINNFEKIYIQTFTYNADFNKLLYYLAEELNFNDFKNVLKTIHNFNQNIEFVSNKDFLNFFIKNYLEKGK